MLTKLKLTLQRVCYILLSRDINQISNDNRTVRKVDLETLVLSTKTVLNEKKDLKCH